jgi:hypothetical protein
MHTSCGKLSGLECKNCKSPRAISLCTSATRPRLVVTPRTAYRVRMWAGHPLVRCERAACVYARARAKRLTVSRER